MIRVADLAGCFRPFFSVRGRRFLIRVASWYLPWFSHRNHCAVGMMVFWASCLHCGAAERELPFRVELFQQPIHTGYTVQDGLPDSEVLRIACERSGEVYAMTDRGIFQFDDERWKKIEDRFEEAIRARYFTDRHLPDETLLEHGDEFGSIRGWETRENETVVAGEHGLFLGENQQWTMLLPQEGAVRWAPFDIRAVGYDLDGQLWFACPQGVGRRHVDAGWRLYTGVDGLPYNDFTCMAVGHKGVWFGTSNGAIRYHRGHWEFRHGRRWLINNQINDIAVAIDGTVWFATPGGISRIQYRPATLRDKALFYENQIERHHRRTSLGFVSPAKLASPGDKSTAVAYASDNDGFFNGLFLGAMSLAYAATGKAEYKQQATRSFNTLAFLSEVTQGGSNPGPSGLIARAVVPTTGPNPNLRDNLGRDRRTRAEDDALWKVMSPRRPIDETGEWYWKCDASADELDGHFFGYALYYDRVCEEEVEKVPVRRVVRRITDHLLDHNFRIIDHDGQPTRWSRLSPEELNENDDNWEERGLNSWSMLTYLLIAHHVTGDRKYREAYMKLAHKEGFAINGMTQPQVISGPGSFHQADDDMSFLNYYHLLRYEQDIKLLDTYRLGVFYHWRIERPERNPFFNFVYAAVCLGKVREDHWGKMDLSPPSDWLDESVDSLKRWPLDLIDWPMSNAHRIDMVPLAEHTRAPGEHEGKGHRVGGGVFGVDEQLATYLEDDVWRLSYQADGTRLREGTAFLLAYYMGLVHGYIRE